MGKTQSQLVERQLQAAFIERTAQIRLAPHPRPCIPSLVYPCDGSEPVVLSRSNMIARFLTHRILLVQRMPVPRDVQWLIVAMVYRGDVATIIHDEQHKKRDLKKKPAGHSRLEVNGTC